MNLLLIFILVGGGGLVVLGLVLGWRQRRRLGGGAERVPAAAGEPGRPSYDPYPPSPLAAPPPQPATEPFETVSTFGEDARPPTRVGKLSKEVLPPLSSCRMGRGSLRPVPTASASGKG